MATIAAPAAPPARKRRSGRDELTVAERAARGRAARRAVPRSSHADWERPAGVKDPVAILREEAVERVPDLVPIRHGRMLDSPFAFFRGAAGVMAADLAASPASGLRVQACGDAHLVNFGFFAAPDRRLVFDLNDFDETLPAPWEWDVKRLAASLAIAGRHRGIDARGRGDLVAGAVAAYRTTMRSMAAMRDIEVWYSRVEAAGLVDRLNGRVTGAAVAKARRGMARARRKDSLRALNRLTVDGGKGGVARIRSDPPLVVPLRDLAPGAEGEALFAAIGGLLTEYRASLSPELRHLMRRYRFVDMARKVVGVGSVGTRAWILLLMGRDNADPLFLQAKEAGPSVLEGPAGASSYRHHGRRVVEGQRLMQAAGDILLGWVTALGVDGRRRDFYVRQLWDAKASIDLERIEPAALGIYAELCGETLARAHARSGDAVAIAAYMGDGPRLDRALVVFAEAYADQTERDHAALEQAVADGEVEAQKGV